MAVVPRSAWERAIQAVESGAEAFSVAAPPSVVVATASTPWGAAAAAGPLAHAGSSIGGAGSGPIQSAQSLGAPGAPHVPAALGPQRFDIGEAPSCSSGLANKVFVQHPMDDFSECLKSDMLAANTRHVGTLVERLSEKARST